ncbi:peroxisomal biogenesis factor 6 [Acrasis kona]|uniref:Peroxisomal biogenesis factor 6 n=1 Tax=Acrasis kona TaxID=1008807 RepID=A0AAW2YWZ7_9EUKA
MIKIIVLLTTALLACAALAGQPVGVPIKIGTNFWNIRGDFKVLYVVNVHTQMSVIQLPNGKFLLIDTIELTDDLRSALDRMTDSGRKIEAIVGVHPFHTTYFKKFYDAFPSVPFYGTPRHLRNIKDVQWQGDLMNEEVRNRWNPDVEIRIPDGAEFEYPEPESTNHFASAWVYHRPSGTIHIDDTVVYADEDSVALRIFGIHKGDMMFHPSINSGLKQYEKAPYAFRDWVLRVIKEWNFDNIVCAHLGNKLGGAKLKLNQTVTSYEPKFRQWTEERRGKY